ncbi:protein kinase C substrate protein [Trypanosoma conorhini]|uniref:Protein kinase C substrate protein n=1 Tax=Trypanosoma conorhini TaxID=83891 RepID=A0A3R7KCK9_9TRYP|nr:protein kinase C substrate protein [Trypanosoma conorhini]RNF03790.1 protein kinase C substrate protein [Trypanosoma conorhini]
MLLFLFVLALVLPSCTALEPSYGVQDGLLERFSTLRREEPFLCLCGNATIMGYQVNDDYCDCPDGSDEPGTSACTNPGMRVKFPAKWNFRCKNLGFKPKEVPHNRINDGICDCCDGSDEYSGIAVCPNVCAEAQEREEKLRLEEEQAKQAGLREKEKMMVQVAVNRANDKVQLANETVELERLRSVVAEKELKLLPLEEREKEEKQRLLDAYKASLEASKEEQEKNQTDNLNTTVTSAMNCIRWSQTGFCGGKEEAPLSDKGCDEVISPSEAGFL